MATTYVVVSGTTSALATFQTAVKAYLDQGYTVSGGIDIEGGNIYQAVVKEGASFVPAFPITDVTSGIAGAGLFKVATDQRQYFPVGFRFTVASSTGNNGYYTVSSAGATFGSGKTTLPVVEAVPNATVDGSIYPTT